MIPGALRRGAKQLVRTVCPTPMMLWLEHKYFEHFGEAETRLVRHLCEPGRDAIDVGANEGCYIHFMRPHARRVYAFEPVPWLAARLSAKFGDDVVVYPTALSQSSGVAQLHIPMVAGQPETGLSTLSPTALADQPTQRELKVTSAPLDAVYSGDVAFIKIDVEGHEEAVLEGGRETITRCHPRILVEIEERHSRGSIDRIARFFDAIDYQGYFLHHNKLRTLDNFDVATMQRPQDIQDYRPGLARSQFADYVNNFLFLPRQESPGTLANIAAELAQE
ncbi:FkbM family methyltransferase [Nitrospirillum sp. BR 11828]|uniref:FkbM family methyltransferase n=1 Tax=Nitrospirillum sp. BR 11828 TaxID=3104325 RepID=UPI002ACA8D0B|nr:FkbM family methyltransferase [Nitrospirillum sp. BR 11828]MDZ5649587.1 FkbM family methyltransferase [Nitrospirillum sp. BR 11828]